jgi:hypothetical protein
MKDSGSWGINGRTIRGAPWIADAFMIAHLWTRQEAGIIGPVLIAQLVGKARFFKPRDCAFIIPAAYLFYLLVSWVLILAFLLEHIVARRSRAGM